MSSSSPLGESVRSFSLPTLKCWDNVNPYTLKYKVWKVGQYLEQAILLQDVIHGANEYPNNNIEGNGTFYYQEIDFDWLHHKKSYSFIDKVG